MKILFLLFPLGILASLSEIQATGRIDPQQITQHDAMGKEENTPLLIDGNMTSCMNIDKQLNASFKITGEFENIEAHIYTEGVQLSSLGNGVDVRIKSSRNNVKCYAAGTRKESNYLVSVYNCSLPGAGSPNITMGIDATGVTDMDDQLNICEVEFHATEVLQNIDSITIPTTYSDTKQGNFSASQDIEGVTSFTIYKDNAQNNFSSTSIPGWIINELNVTMNISDEHFNATKVYRKKEYSITALTVIIVCCFTSFTTAIMGIIIFANHWMDFRKKNKRTKTKSSSDGKSNVFYLDIETGNTSTVVEETPKEQEENCSTFKPKIKKTSASVEENAPSTEYVDNNLKDCAIYDSKEILEAKTDSGVAMAENELYAAFK